MELDSHLEENPLQHSKGWINFFFFLCWMFYKQRSFITYFFKDMSEKKNRYWWSPQRNVMTFIATKPGFLVAKDEM